MPIKFFPRDVIRGKSRKVGDRFVAMFMGQECVFQIEEHHGVFFMATLFATPTQGR